MVERLLLCGEQRDLRHELRRFIHRAHLDEHDIRQRERRAGRPPAF